MLTTPGGPPVIGAPSLRALVAIRRQGLVHDLYGPASIERGNLESLADVLPATPPWLTVHEDDPSIELPSRLAQVDEADRATLRLALAVGAGLVIIEEPAKERAKLSFFKCEGVLSMLVWAHRQGRLTAVMPMVKALRSLGQGHVLPPQEQLDALKRALSSMAD